MNRDAGFLSVGALCAVALLPLAMPTACAARPALAPQPAPPAQPASAGQPASAAQPAPPAQPASGVHPDTIGDLIARGREALEAGKPAEAEKLFEQAAEQDKNTIRTRTWVLRSWMDQGRINDALDAIDALAKTQPKEGAKGAELDYLYGMAFSQKARGYLTTGVGGGAIQMALEDAAQFLEKAVKTDPELARDAFLPLAEAAWYCQKLDVARAAAETATQRTPKNVDAQFLLGRIALSQYSSAKDDAGRKAEADAALDRARKAFTDALEVLGKNPDPVHVDMAAKVLVNLGHVAVWKQSLEEATLAYAQAMRLNPSLVDMHQVHGALGGERFLTAVEAAAAEAKEPNVAALAWWVGWARLDQKQYEKADEAFSAAVAQDPKFINTWYFLAVARHAKQDMEGAIGAFHRYADEDAPDLAVMLLKDPDTSVRVIDGLVAWCAEKQRNADAAFLSELECGIYPNESRYWNNAGLFWRDGGEAMQKSADPDAKKKSAEMFEKSWAAYGKALELEPDNPALLNDAAVILHYYLDRDLEKAKAMYKKATERAKVELAKPDLTKELRELYETALRDSTNNLAKLEKGEKTDKG
jgi:tetratricopeptide (TPR) repeat protein